MGPTREDTALLPGTDARPAEQISSCRMVWRYKHALDITVVNPLQTAYIDQSAAVQGHALRKSFERKMLRHGDSCKEVGLIFRPLPIAHMPMDTLVG